MKKKLKLWSAHGPVNWLILSAAVIIADQVTKYWVASEFSLFDSVAIMPHLNLTLLHNTGAAFSFLADAGGWQRWFFIILGSVVSIGIMVWLRKLPENQGFALPLGLSLILGGAVGNIIDRAWHGYVIDFIDFYYGSWHWPAFNIADIAITLGAFFFIVDSVQDLHRAGKKD
ncbi:MAG: signal peptidase II [Gammaproteobacteria bacterium]|nr:signal peptidase II [Gammaproteobacteria bacterium]